MRYVGLKSGFAAFGVFALILSVGMPLLAGTPTTTNFYLDGVGVGNVMAGVYTSPYNAVIGATLTGGNPPTVNGGTALNVICDDFASESFDDEDWTAYVTNLTSLTTGAYGTPETQLKWGETNSVVVNDSSEATAVGESSYSVNDTSKPLSQLQAYDVAALLAIDISGIQDTTADATLLDDYSYAMWALFDTNTTTNTDPALDQLSTYGGGSPAQTAVEQQAIIYLYTAVNDVLNGKGNGGTTPLSTYLSNYNVTIYSYDKLAGNPTCYDGTTSCPPPPQEFITVTAVPEASSLAMFAAYLLFGGGSLLFFGRRHMLQNR